MLFCYNSLTPIYNTSGPREHSQVVWSKGEFVKWYGFCSVWKCICIIIIRKHSPVTQCRPDIHLLLIQPWQCNIPLLPWCMAYITAARQLAMKVCNVAYIALFHVTDDFIAIQFSYLWPEKGTEYNKHVFTKGALDCMCSLLMKHLQQGATRTCMQPEHQ